jgi:hypothetical protein
MPLLFTAQNLSLLALIRVDFVPLSEIGEQLMSETATWQPSASIPNLLKRAAIMAEIRRFLPIAASWRWKPVHESGNGNGYSSGPV